MKDLKLFSEGQVTVDENEIELYKDFLEDYFKTKAINKVLGQTLEEEKKFLLERKKFILGSIILEEDDIKRLEFTQENEKLSKRISEIDKESYS